MESKKQKFVLGIGAPRCGTTWAYQNLRTASSLYVPPIKELRYFHGKRHENERASAIGKVLNRKDLSASDRAFIEQWKKVQDGNLKDYTSLFSRAGAVGEVSPIYSIMSPEAVKSVKMVLEPYDVKIFYFMRNPLYRDISHIIFTLHRQAKISEPRPEQDYLDFINTRSFIRRSAYLRNVRNWRAPFGTDLNLYYFDDLANSPRKFFKRFCTELGLEFDLDKVQKNPLNKSGSGNRFKIDIPKEVLTVLRDRHLSALLKWKFLPKRILEKWWGDLETFDLS